MNALKVKVIFSATMSRFCILYNLFYPLFLSLSLSLSLFLSVFRKYNKNLIYPAM